jgi:hypothetical protein
MLTRQETLPYQAAAVSGVSPSLKMQHATNVLIAAAPFILAAYHNGEQVISAKNELLFLPFDCWLTQLDFPERLPFVTQLTAELKPCLPAEDDTKADLQDVFVTGAPERMGLAQALSVVVSQSASVRRDRFGKVQRALQQFFDEPHVDREQFIEVILSHAESLTEHANSWDNFRGAFTKNNMASPPPSQSQSQEGGIGLSAEEVPSEDQVIRYLRIILALECDPVLRFVVPDVESVAPRHRDKVIVQSGGEADHLSIELICYYTSLEKRKQLADALQYYANACHFGAVSRVSDDRLLLRQVNAKRIGAYYHLYCKSMQRAHDQQRVAAISPIKNDSLPSGLTRVGFYGEACAERVPTPMPVFDGADERPAKRLKLSREASEVDDGLSQSPSQAKPRQG